MTTFSKLDRLPVQPVGYIPKLIFVTFNCNRMYREQLAKPIDWHYTDPTTIWIKVKIGILKPICNHKKKKIYIRETRCRYAV